MFLCPLDSDIWNRTAHASAPPPGSTPPPPHHRPHSPPQMVPSLRPLWHRVTSLSQWPHPHQLQRWRRGPGREHELTWPVDGSWAHFLWTRRENPKGENKPCTGQVYTSVHMTYLASLLHKSHLFLTLFSAGETFFRGLQGLQSYRRSSSHRLSIIQLMQDTIHRAGGNKQSNAYTHSPTTMLYVALLITNMFLSCSFVQQVPTMML